MLEDGKLAVARHVISPGGGNCVTTPLAVKMAFTGVARSQKLLHRRPKFDSQQEYFSPPN
jgi:hypothetical protein